MASTSAESPVAVGTGGPSAEALRSGRIDAYYGVDTEFATLQNYGLKLRELPKTDFDRRVPNIGVMVSGKDRSGSATI